jgi:hypothetical protein
MCVSFFPTVFVWDIFRELRLKCEQRYTLRLHAMCSLLLPDYTHYSNVHVHFSNRSPNLRFQPLTVAALSKAWTVLARLNARIVGSNPIQDMDVWCMCAFILCLCFPVLRQWPCSGLITRPRSPTVCEKWLRNWIRGLGSEWAGKAIKKLKILW